MVFRVHDGVIYVSVVFRVRECITIVSVVFRVHVGIIIISLVCRVHGGIGATRDVKVSKSAFLACHQCYSAGSSLAWDLNLRALVCGIF